MKQAKQTASRTSPSKATIVNTFHADAPVLKAQPALLRGMLGLFCVWIAILITLYFTTIYPRHAPHDLRPPEASEAHA